MISPTFSSSSGHYTTISTQIRSRSLKFFESVKILLTDYLVTRRMGEQWTSCVSRFYSRATLANGTHCSALYFPSPESVTSACPHATPARSGTLSDRRYYCGSIQGYLPTHPSISPVWFLGQINDWGRKTPRALSQVQMLGIAPKFQHSFRSTLQYI
jgi:hypothetical protein